jgi:hypothetical protein
MGWEKAHLLTDNVHSELWCRSPPLPGFCILAISPLRVEKKPSLQQARRKRDLPPYLLHRAYFRYIFPPSACNPPRSLAHVPRLLQLDPAALQHTLTHRVVAARGEAITTPLSLKDAQNTSLAIVTALYDRLFSWIVGRINDRIHPRSTDGPELSRQASQLSLSQSGRVGQTVIGT